MSTMLDSRLCFAKSRGRSDGTPTVDRFDMLIVVVQDTFPFKGFLSVGGRF